MEKLTQSYRPAQQQYALPVTFNQGKPTLHPPVPHGFSISAGSGSQRNEADFGMQVIKGFFNSGSSPAPRTGSTRPHGAIANSDSRIHPAKVIRKESEEERKESVERIGLPPSGTEPGAKEAEMVRLHLLGHSQREIAARVGYSQGVVCGILRAQGYSDPNHSLLMQEQKEEIVRLHALGHSQRKIAAQVGCSQGTVSNILAAEGYNGPIQVLLTQEQKNQIVQLHSLGHAQREIADIVGCSQSSVGRILHDRLQS